MKQTLLLLSLIISIQVNATIKIAVIDTGFDFNSTWTDASTHALIKPKLCPGKHYDFVTPKNKKPQDNHGHGTHIAGLIAKYAENTDYCLIIMKFYDPNIKDLTQEYTIKAIKQAIAEDVDIINYSGGGLSPSKPEKEAIELAQKKGIKIVVAAGNEHTELKPFFKIKGTCIGYYPACYNALIARVGNVDAKGDIAPTSNFGSFITAWEMGEEVLSLGIGNKYVKMSGTSQATAVHTGKLVKRLNTFKKLDSEPNDKLSKSYNRSVASKLHKK